jgi:hypothetical protein
MKLNRVWIGAAAAAVLAGSLAVAGCTRSDDESDEAQVAATEQVSGDQTDETTGTVSGEDVGVTEYARGGGAHGGGAHGGARGGAHGGARGGAHGGFGHGRGGWGHGGWGHGGWGRGGWGRGWGWGPGWWHGRRWYW